MAMSDEQLPSLIPAAPEPTERIGFRRRLKATRDRLIHEAATRMISLGRERPRLRQAGYWLYGAATRYLPRGREVQKLGQLGETVYRGAQPSLRAFRTLRDLGVGTVINLRPECDYERPIVEKLGMRYLYMPLPPLDAPTIAVTIEFIKATTDPAHGVVFFHCFHGVDRTGTMAACLRIARDGWSVDEALEEMRQYKVHEQGQKAKVAFLDEFHRYWHAQDPRFRAEVLHQALPEAPPPVVPWWKKAGHWVGDRVRRLWPGHDERTP